MKRERITAWVTKNALTKGIRKICGEVCHDINSDMFTYDTYGVAHGNDWHRTPEEALARVEVMRKNKIKSLEKKLGELASMRFDLPE